MVVEFYLCLLSIVSSIHSLYNLPRHNYISMVDKKVYPNKTFSKSDPNNMTALIDHNSFFDIICPNNNDLYKSLLVEHNCPVMLL